MVLFQFLNLTTPSVHDFKGSLTFWEYKVSSIIPSSGRNVVRRAESGWEVRSACRKIKVVQRDAAGRTQGDFIIDQRCGRTQHNHGFST